MSWLDEQLSEQFHRWEERGRGWQVFPEPVEPEPPFVPFNGHFLPAAPVIDDGCRPTFLSSLVQRLSQKLSTEPPPAPVEPESEEEPEPTPLARESLVELQASLPDKLDIPKEAFEQFLLNLSMCREPIAFELIGSHKKVAAQFVAGESDAPLLRRQLQAYFPEAVFVYYRCHSKDCRKTSIREDLAEAETSHFFEQVQFSAEEKAYFRPKVLAMRETWTTRLDEEIQSQNLKLAHVKDRLNRLTDAYLDQALDKTMFEERKKALLLEQKGVEEQLADLSRRNSEQPKRLEQFLELTGTAWLSYQLAFPEEKREMLNIITSNRSVNAKTLGLEPSLAYQPVVNRFKNSDGAPAWS
jgi:hypothetical protein